MLSLILAPSVPVMLPSLTSLVFSLRPMTPIMLPPTTPLTVMAAPRMLFFLLFCIDVIFPIFFTHVKLFSFGEKSTVLPFAETVLVLSEGGTCRTLKSVNPGDNHTLEVVIVGFKDELAK